MAAARRAASRSGRVGRVRLSHARGVRVRYRIERVVDPAFVASYEAAMLARCGDDPLPNPRRVRHGIPTGLRFSRSGTKRNLGVLRRHVNVFLALTK